MSSGSSRANLLSLTSPVMFEFSGWMNEVFISLRIMSVTGTVGDLLVGLNGDCFTQIKVSDCWKSHFQFYQFPKSFDPRLGSIPVRHRTPL